MTDKADLVERLLADIAQTRVESWDQTIGKDGASAIRPVVKAYIDTLLEPSGDVIAQAEKIAIEPLTYYGTPRDLAHNVVQALAASSLLRTGDTGGWNEAIEAAAKKANEFYVEALAQAKAALEQGKERLGHPQLMAAAIEAAIRELNRPEPVRTGEEGKLRERIAELEKALKPFATFSGGDDRKDDIIAAKNNGQYCLPDGHGFECVWSDEDVGGEVHFTAGQFRRARAALSTPPASGDEK